MTLRILDSPDPSETVHRLREAIAAAIPEARVEVLATSPGHFEIRVCSAIFEGKPLVRQQQLVYQAIAPLMSGDAPPVHAIDRLSTRTP
ncbi:MAG: BolA/IbaG family iron-sulfur metabolism protein [Myxococcota bacterium]